jgi:hypothetical protein
MIRIAIIAACLIWHFAILSPAFFCTAQDGLTDDPDGIACERADLLVVCPAEYQPALQHWIAYRENQGHVIRVIAPERSAAVLAERIREVARQSELKFVFLIGDVESKRKVAARPVVVETPALVLSNTGNSDIVALEHSTIREKTETASSLMTVPIHYVPAQVNVRYGSEPEISTDHPYSDLNGDGLPDIALGRLPASSPAEVRDYLNRVIAYETQQFEDHSWRRRINFVAGVGGFGTAIDSVLEQFTKEAITGLIPAEYQTAMTMASWQSPFCPDPRQFSQRVIERFNQGCLFWVYIGHGQPTELDRLRLPDQRLPILNESLASQIDCPEGSPIAIFLACYTGAIDHEQDCLAKVMLRQPQGPIAIVGGTRVTMPYAMSTLMLEVADDYFNSPIDSLGELLRSAKRKMVLNHRDDGWLATDQDETTNREPQTEYDRLRQMVQNTGKALSPTPELLAAECEEHLNLMHLFGDPLLKLKKPQWVELQTDAKGKTGTQLTIRGSVPMGGHLCIDLAYPRDRFRQRPQYRKQYEATDEAFSQYEAAYEAANNLTCDTCLNVVEAGPFEATLHIPADVSGDCLVRCILSSPDGFALGSTKLFIEK